MMLSSVAPGMITVQPHMHGTSFDLVDDEDMPLMYPRPGLDVRALALEGSGRLGGPLRWVESEPFQLVVCGVIVVNIFLVSNSRTHPEDAPASQWVVEQAILCFYIAEVVLRILHFRLRYFFWSCSETMWNYLDLFIVGYGVCDQWAIDGGHPHSDLMALRGFRIVRLIRVFRVVQTLLQGDFHWVDGPTFQGSVGIVIALNALFMGLETESVHNTLWWWVNQVFLIFFLFEISVRMRRAGFRRFLWAGDDLMWNYLDSMIVFTGVLDQWLVPIAELMLRTDQDAINGNFSQMIMLVRILRLMRMLRLLRLVKAVRPLYHLAVGIMKALQSMFWVLVLTMVALYAFALITTELIGKGMLPEARNIDADSRALFGTVPDSLFTLFGLMNKQYWQDITPMFVVLPWAKPVWVIFTILSSWALLSVMTGVVSDNMLEVRQAQEQKSSDAWEEFRDRLLQMLTEVFTAADKDGSRSLEKEEYVEILTSPFHVNRLQKFSHVPIQDMINMFDWIDVGGLGSISFEDFVHGFDWLNEPVTGKSLLKLESCVRQRCCVLERGIRSSRRQLRTVDEECHRQFVEAKQALEQAKTRFEEQAEQRTADAEVLEAEAKVLRAEASKCWTASVSASKAEERAQIAAAEQRARDAAARLQEEMPSHGEGSSSRSLSAMANRLRGGVQAAFRPLSPARIRGVSPTGKGRGREIRRQGTPWHL